MYRRFRKHTLFRPDASGLALSLDTGEPISLIYKCTVVEVLYLVPNFGFF